MRLGMPSLTFSDRRPNGTAAHRSRWTATTPKWTYLVHQMVRPGATRRPWMQIDIPLIAWNQGEPAAGYIPFLMSRMSRSPFRGAEGGATRTLWSVNGIEMRMQHVIFAPVTRCAPVL
jgi:hypothetical protein